MGCRDGGPEKPKYEKRDTEEVYLLIGRGVREGFTIQTDKEWALKLAAEFGDLLIGPVPVVVDYRPLGEST